VFLEDPPDIIVCQITVSGHQKGNSSSDVGSGHGCSRLAGVGVSPSVSTRNDVLSWSRYFRLELSSGRSSGAEGSNTVTNGGGTDSNAVKGVSWGVSASTAGSGVTEGENGDDSSNNPSTHDFIVPVVTGSTSP